MKYLMSSKTEANKRKLLDLVDFIHREEQGSLAHDLGVCEDEIREWIRKGEIPHNLY